MDKTKFSFKEWFKNLDKKKILSIALNTLIWIFVIFSLLITILVFSAQGSKDGVPAIFGKSLITISTDSMEPTYKAGDLVFMEKLSAEEIENLQPNQIITFRAPIDIDGDGMVGDINTHRIEKVEGNRFVTKGDHNLIPDNEGDDPYTVHMSDVIGLCTEDGKIGGLGNVISFLRSSLGFFLFIVLPLILFFLYELYNFITILVTERSKKAASAAVAIDEEEIKKRAIEEYLAKQKNEEEIKKRAIEEYLAAKEAENSASERAEDSSSLASSDAGEFAEAKEDGNTDK
jgi:signal peptidase